MLESLLVLSVVRYLMWYRLKVLIIIEIFTWYNCLVNKYVWVDYYSIYDSSSLSLKLFCLLRFCPLSLIL